MAQETDFIPEGLVTSFKATETNVIPLDTAVLLGTFIRGDDSSMALVRSPAGGIHKLARGDYLGRAVVTRRVGDEQPGGVLRPAVRSLDVAHGAALLRDAVHRHPADGRLVAIPPEEGHVLMERGVQLRGRQWRSKHLGAI